SLRNSRVRGFSVPGLPEDIAPRGDFRGGLDGRLEAGFAARLTGPGKAVSVPAGQPAERDSLIRGVHEPTVAHVDAHVPDLVRRRLRAGVAEEENVGRLEPREPNPPGSRHLAAHGVSRSTFQGSRERGAAGIRL